jgi:uncharacterized protein
MRSSAHIIIAVLTGLSGLAQDALLVKVPISENAVQLKWYLPGLVSTEGFHVYRQEVGSDSWEQLTEKPVRFRDHRFSETDLVADPQLVSYVDMVDRIAAPEGILLLAVLVKSFRSEAYSRYLGIFYEDRNAAGAKTYRYRIQGAESKKEIYSAEIKSGKFVQPAAPQNVNFSLSGRNVSITWKAEPSRHYGVFIYRRHADSALYHRLTQDPLMTPIAKTTGGADQGKNTFVDRNVPPGKYFYVLEGIDFFGDASQRSAEMMVTVKDNVPPAAPEGLSGNAEGQKLNLSWKKRVREPDLAGYNIYRTNRNDMDYARLNTSMLPFDSAHFQDSVPGPGTFLYRVSSIDLEGNESWSNPYFLEAFDKYPPAKPLGVKARADSGRTVLTWQPGAEKDLKGYIVFRSITGSDLSKFVRITPSPVSSCTFTDAIGENTRNKFFYRIAALDESLNKSPFSETVSVQQPDREPPSSPFVKSVSATDKEHIAIIWFANPEPDLAGYHVYRKAERDSGFTRQNVRMLSAQSTQYTDRFAEPGRLYEYCIRATDSTGNVSASSNVSKARIMIKASNMNIQSLSARYKPRHSRVELSWHTEAPTEVLKGYGVYRSEASGGQLQLIAPVTREPSFTDRSIEKNKVYVYQVRAYANAGDIIRSELITVRTTDSN